MSYKIDLSELTREGAVSLTQQVVDRFTSAIDAVRWFTPTSSASSPSWGT